MRGQRARIGDLVDGALRRWNLERATREHRAILLWATLVGEEIARNTEAAAVKDHVLLVSARTHAWAQTLDLMKPQVLARLRERLGQDVVRDVHFSAGRRVERRARPASAQVDNLRHQEAVILSEAERAEAERAAAEVKDPELRQVAARAFGSLLMARKRLEAQGYRLCEGCGRMFRGKGKRCAKCGRRGRR